MNTPRRPGAEVLIRLVITWRKDPVTGRAPLIITGRFGNLTTYLMLHQYVSETFQVPIEYIKVRRSGWMVVESLEDWIPQARTLALYYSMDETRGGPPDKYCYFMIR